LSRKEQIIEAAMKLFAQKGYHATSMQEIAEHSGLAKGSLYNYFKSKEEIALSIFRFHYERLFHQFSQIAKDYTLSPREKFFKQLSLQIEAFYEHKEFVQMHMGEHVEKVSEEVHALVFHIRTQMFNWYVKAMLEIYGERLRPFAGDCAIMLNGMLKEYLFYTVFEQKEIAFQRLAPFLMKRLDAIVDSLLSGETSLLIEQDDEKMVEQQINEMIAQMMEQAKDDADLMELLFMFKREIGSENPRKFMIEAFLLYLERTKLSEFLPALEAKLALYLK
jgi:AcrR family transcriptional regulator